MDHIITSKGIDCFRRGDTVEINPFRAVNHRDGNSVDGHYNFKIWNTILLACLTVVNPNLQIIGCRNRFRGARIVKGNKAIR